MIRWPGKIAAGWVSDEIVADLDILPTLAHLIGEGERIPMDRPIDGINQSDFLLGKREKSNREFVVAYVGDTVFAVKWRNMKVHFVTTEATHSVIQSHTFPLVFDLEEDPKEASELIDSHGYIHAWVIEPVRKILDELGASMRMYPNIRPGQDFAGYE